MNAEKQTDRPPVSPPLPRAIAALEETRSALQREPRTSYEGRRSIALGKTWRQKPSTIRASKWQKGRGSSMVRIICGNFQDTGTKPGGQ